VIENVEGLSPKLQTVFLIETELLEQRGVEIGQPRPVNDPRATFPKVPAFGIRKAADRTIAPVPQHYWPAKGRIQVGNIGFWVSRFQNYWSQPEA